MSNRPSRRPPAAGRDAPVMRHIIVCVVALFIMSAGVWSLLNAQAPYHPAEYGEAVAVEPDEVSRNDAVLMSVASGD